MTGIIRAGICLAIRLPVLEFERSGEFEKAEPGKNRKVRSLAEKSGISEFAAGIFLIDCRFGGLPEQCGVFLLRGEKTALIDTGPSVSSGIVTDALESLGVDRLDYVLLTHLHLDHAGAASHLLERYPSATAYIYEGSIRFLVDPERLVKSAWRSLGEMARHYGEMAPVPQERIQLLEDGSEFHLGSGRVLRAIQTPGHSGGHFAFHEVRGNALFCGDALGHFIQAGSYVYPATPAPEFNPDLSHASASRLAALSPETLFFTHYGSSTEPASVFAHFHSQVDRFVEIASELPEDRRDAAHLTDVLMRDFPPMQPEEEAFVRGIMRVNSAGLLHYLQIPG